MCFGLVLSWSNVCCCGPIELGVWCPLISNCFEFQPFYGGINFSNTLLMSLLFVTTKIGKMIFCAVTFPRTCGRHSSFSRPDCSGCCGWFLASSDSRVGWDQCVAKEFPHHHPICSCVGGGTFGFGLQIFYATFSNNNRPTWSSEETYLPTWSSSLQNRMFFLPRAPVTLGRHLIPWIWWRRTWWWSCDPPASSRSAEIWNRRGGAAKAFEALSILKTKAARFVFGGGWNGDKGKLY